MDNMYLDIYYFAIPDRLCWTHWQQFMGENTESPWYPTDTYEVPQINFPLNGFDTGTIADYMGVPVGIEGYKSISALPFRAYALCADQWFRDQNVQQPLLIPLGDETDTGVNTGDQITDIALGGKPFIVNKYHDYFTSCLPSPQKGPDITIFGTEVGSAVSKFIPVSTGVNRFPIAPERDPVGITGFNLNNEGTGNIVTVLGRGSSTSTTNAYIQSDIARPFEPTNLWADYGQMQITINQLRLAFQLQKFYEKNARGGTRYRELIKMHFGVTNPDARMMIPEYLGGTRVPISIHQVANQSQSSDADLGDVGAMSNTYDVHEDFVKSFTEHGIILGLCCVRYDHTYSQGLERFWTRTDKLHFYWPVFANVGEQPIYKYELMLTPEEPDYPVFGFNEAWSEYRYKPSRVSGEMRPNIQNNLANWHLADNYKFESMDDVPSLSADWMREDKTNVDRVLAVTSSNSNQVFADFYVRNICTRPMPMYSIPGLIDHH